MWFDEIHVQSGCSSDHYEGKAAFIDGVAGLDGCGESLEYRLCGFEALACWC